MGKTERKLTENLTQTSRNVNVPRLIIVGVQEIIYILLLVLGITTLCGVTSYWFPQQARTVCIGASCGAVGIWGTTLVEKIFKVKIGVFVDVIIMVDLFFSVVLGEACQVFLHVVGYDKILHGIGTAELALVGYVIAKFFLAKSKTVKKHQVVYALIFGFFFALGVQMLWELYEFTFDMVAGTNMQKYLPDQFQDYVDLVNGVLDFDKITDEQIVEFYRQFSGYHYAVEDTMYDVVADVVGASCGIIGSGLVFHFFPHLQDSLLKDNRKTEVVDTENNSDMVLLLQDDQNGELTDTEKPIFSEDDSTEE